MFYLHFLFVRFPFFICWTFILLVQTHFCGRQTSDKVERQTLIVVKYVLFRFFQASFSIFLIFLFICSIVAFIFVKFPIYLFHFHTFGSDSFLWVANFRQSWASDSYQCKMFQKSFKPPTIQVHWKQDQIYESKVGMDIWYRQSSIWIL